MAHNRILIHNYSGQFCAAGSCSALPNFLRRHYSHAVEITECLPECEDKWCLAIVRGKPDRSYFHFVESLRNQCPEAALMGILCSAPLHAGESRDSASLLDDFLVCPFQEDELLQRIHRVLRLSPVRNPQSAAIRCRIEGLVGDSEPLLQVLAKLPGIARAGATVLVTGATGTGKELFARGVHYLSPRSGKPFVPVNCAALPDHLFENEMFGHSKGAYTDASVAEGGLISAADRGTLFLDEVESLSAAAQAKLLRFLQHREYRPLGSPRTLVADVRIVAATNADLLRRAQTGQFREDLYHRLNVLRLHVPALSERVDDIPALARHFAALFAAQFQRSQVVISAGALRKLISYDWPGNVRELECAIQRAVVVAGDDNVIRPSDIELEMPSPAGHRHDFALRDAKNEAVSRVERSYLTDLMASHHGNVSQAAKFAGKHRRALQRLLTKHQISRADFSA